MRLRRSHTSTGLTLGLVLLAVSVSRPVRAQDARIVRACHPEGSMLGVALPDTVAADEGVPEPIRRTAWTSYRYGQLFVLRRTSLRLPSDSVVIVPWIRTVHGMHIAPDGSAVWMSPGVESHVGGILRERAAWSGGLPTFDVYEAYPEPMGPGGQYGEHPDGMMTPEEYFDFCSLEVDLHLVESGEDGREIAPLAWARSSGGAWRRAPAFQHLQEWASAIAEARVRRLSPDMAGTWAATLRMPSGQEHHFHMRTSERTYGTWTRALVWGQRVERPPWEPAADGYLIRYWISSAEEDLPSSQGYPGDVLCSVYGDILVGVSPPRDPSCRVSGFRDWGVEFPDTPDGQRQGHWNGLLEALGADPELSRSLRERTTWREQAGVAASIVYPLGVFTGTDDSLRFAQDIPVAPDRVIRFEAVRISRDVVREPDR